MNAIKECLSHAVQAGPGEVAKAARRVKKIDEVLARMVTEHKMFLGVEHHAKEALAAHALKLREERDQVTALINSSEFPRLSLEPLAWRNKDGWPKIALLGLDMPRMTIMVTRTRYYYNWGYGDISYRKLVRPVLPPPLVACYKDVFAKLMKM